MPRGCALLHVPTRNQRLIRSSLPTSHGWQPPPGSAASVKAIPNPLPPSAKPAFVAEFEFVGTIDNAPYLCIPAAIAWRRDVCGGEALIAEYCIGLAREGGRRVAEVLGTEVMDNVEGTLTQTPLVNVRLPITIATSSSPPAQSAAQGDETVSAADVGAVLNWLLERLVQDHDTFIAGTYHNGALWARFSAQVYLELADFAWAADVLSKLCTRVRAGEWRADKAPSAAAESVVEQGAVAAAEAPVVPP